MDGPTLIIEKFSQNLIYTPLEASREILMGGGGD